LIGYASGSSFEYEIEDNLRMKMLLMSPKYIFNFQEKILVKVIPGVRWYIVKMSANLFTRSESRVSERKNAAPERRQFTLGSLLISTGLENI
jgi:hypothetical protein